MDAGYEALDLKKLQTPLYEEFLNTSNSSTDSPCLENMCQENAVNNAKLPPKSKPSPSKVASGMSAVLQIDTINRMSPSRDICGRWYGHSFHTGCRPRDRNRNFLDWILFRSSASNAGNLCERCGDHSNLHGVICSCIDCFLSSGRLYRFHYAVSRAFFIAKARRGTCTLAASDAPDVVLHRANYLFNNGFGVYNIFKNNCKDFAIYCKTCLLIMTSLSVGRSGQLSSFTAAFSAIASSPLRFLTVNPGGLTLVVSNMYCVGRYVSDIGVRRDAVKIPVERLVT